MNEFLNYIKNHLKKNETITMEITIGKTGVGMADSSLRMAKRIDKELK